MFMYEKDNKLNLTFDKTVIPPDVPDLVISKEDGITKVSIEGEQSSLPSVTDADNGKTLIVQDGQWVLGVGGGGTPEYYIATLEDTSWMENGVKYVLPSGADISKIYAVGDSVYYNDPKLTCVAMDSDGKLYALCMNDFVCSSLIFEYDASENAYIVFSEPFNMPSTIKLYHT